MRNYVIFVALVLGLGGCSGGTLSLTPPDFTLRYAWPVVELERYEPVVFPAGSGRGPGQVFGPSWGVEVEYPEYSMKR